MGPYHVFILLFNWFRRIPLFSALLLPFISFLVRIPFFITHLIFAFHPHFAFHKILQFIALAPLTGADPVFSSHYAFFLLPLLLNRACRAAEIKKGCVG